ncbi:MAG: hypothetical protein EOP90_12400 [Lysobacteraceae bacterium]|nr:MAG: hypothetical protein EOP90_12400 [Xanthomonadaceae bacterium]
MSLREFPLPSLLALLVLSACAANARAEDDQVDPAFAATSNWGPGWDRLDFGSLDETAVAVARSGDGGFIVCHSVPGGAAGARIGLYKLDARGRRLASGFGTSGHVLKDAFLSSVTDMTVDGSGRIIVVGNTPGPAGIEDFGVVRFLADGSDDPSFAGDGGTGDGFDDTSGAIDVFYRDRPMSVIAEPDGRIVVAGSVFAQDDSDVRWGMIRFNADGSRDARVAGRFAAGQKAIGSRVLRIADGHYVVAGSSLIAANDTDFGARIVAPGFTVDSGYSDAATFAFDVPAGDGSIYDYLSDVAAVDPWTLVLAGVASTKTAVNRIRVLPGGGGAPATLALDAGFVGGGVASFLHNYVSPLDITGTNGAYGTAATRVALRSDGSIVLSGRFKDTTEDRWYGIVTRLHADGTGDDAFGPLVPTQFYEAPTSAGPGSSDTGFADVLIDAGRPVLVGTSLDSLGDTDGVIMRLQSDLLFTDSFD